MKTFKSFLPLLPMALLALASQGALADGAAYEMPQHFDSATSRADVSQQTHAARGAGRIAQGEAQYEMPTTMSSNLSRAQVRAEAIEARRLGLVAQGEMPVRDATAAEREQLREAGLKAQQRYALR